MKEELCIEVDSNDNPLSLRPRRDFYDLNIIHRGVSVLIINDNNEALIQKRSIKKGWNPGLFDFSVSGTVGDEEVIDCIIRELKEELNLTVNITDLIFHFKLSPKEKNDKSFTYFFTANFDIKEYDIKSIQLDNNEVESVELISMMDLDFKLKKNPEKYSPQFKIVYEKWRRENRS